MPSLVQRNIDKETETQIEKSIYWSLRDSYTRKPCKHTTQGLLEPTYLIIILIP